MSDSATPWTAARQASLSIINSRNPPKPMPIVSVMPSNHLILCHPLLLLPSIFPSIRVFSNESALRIRWPKHWSFSFSISPMYYCFSILATQQAMDRSSAFKFWRWPWFLSLGHADHLVWPGLKKQRQCARDLREDGSESWARVTSSI